MEKASLAAAARSTESSYELSVAAGVEAMSLTSRGSHECQPEMPSGVGNAPDAQGTASDVVEGEGIPATAVSSRVRRDGSGVRSILDLNDSPGLQLPGEYNYPYRQPNHTFLHAARFHCCTDFPAGLQLRGPPSSSRTGRQHGRQPLPGVSPTFARTIS